MSQSQKIVFFGNEQLATGVESQPLLFEALLKSQHKILALVVHSSHQTSRKQKREPIVELASAHDIPVVNPTKAIDALEQLSALRADCGVLAAYGKMVPQEVIDLFPGGIINLHPSALPKLRGSTPIEGSILGGLTETAVSVMKLVKQMDAGPVYVQEKVQINDYMSKQDLVNRLHEAGKDSLLSVLDNLETFEKELKEQDETDATFCTLISKADGRIDWAKPAEIIEREVRAYAGWPKSHTHIGEINLVITSAEVSSGWGSPAGTIAVDFASATLLIQCLNSSLKVVSLAPAGKAQMSVKDFLNGYKQKLLHVEQLEIRS